MTAFGTVNKSSALTVNNNDTVSTTIDVGTNPDLLVVVADLGTSAFGFTTVTIGGEELSPREDRQSFGRNVYIWDLIDPPDMSGSQTLEIVTTGFINGVAMGYAASGGEVEFHSDNDGASASGAVADTIDTDSTLGMTFIAGDSSGGPHTALSGTTEDYNTSGMVFGHETAATSGSREVGWDGSGIHSTVRSTYVASSPAVAPDPIGLEVGLNAGTIAYDGPVELPGTRTRALTIGLRAGAIAFTATRHVALVGNGLHTSEMTDGLRSDGQPSEEGDALTWHPGRTPSFDEPTGGGGASLTVKEADGSPSVSSVDTIAFSGATVTDDGSGDVTVTITSGVSEIADLPTAEADDTLVLAPDGVGGVEWRAEAGGGGGSDPALNVFKYDTFK